MNKNEVLKIMTILEVSYPNWVAKLDDEKRQMMVGLWTELFAEDDPNMIATAVKAILISDPNPFPPTIAAIKQKAYSLTHPFRTEMDVWGLITHALRNSIHHAEEEHANLPPEIQIAVTPAQLREWAMQDTEQLNTVIASNFMRSYRARTAYTQQNELLPHKMVETIDTLKELFRLDNKDNWDDPNE